MIPQLNHIYKCYWHTENPTEDDIYYVNVIIGIEGNTIYGHCIDTNSTSYFDEDTSLAVLLEWPLNTWSDYEDGTFILLGTIDDFPELFI